MAGEIISERRAPSNRNGGRHHRGFASDFPRNPQDTKQPKRRQYSEALKRQMVAETQVPGASVSIVARRHDVNSNQLFRWRRQLLPKAAVESSAMVPVEIAADGDRPRRPDRDGVIEITFGCGARVRLRGEVSSEALRQVIELLR
jgi:transposase